MTSRAYMDAIRSYTPDEDSLAVWYFGQNGFVLKAGNGPLIGLDLYLTDSCGTGTIHLPFRLNRQLPVFVEPEDLDVDYFVTTHAHDDHADPETIARVAASRRMRWIGPWEALEKYTQCGVPAEDCALLHPRQTLPLTGGASITGEFALPTDATELNHIGVLLKFASGITFYNTGDTAYSELLADLLPHGMDVCAICINGGCHNLSAHEAARLTHAIKPAVAIPTHYDMMVNNVGNPEMFRTAVDQLGGGIRVEILDYYRLWTYRKPAPTDRIAL